jgi:putative ABC transport system ATP-binding protein
LIEVRELCKTYGVGVTRVQALKNISFRIEAGGFCAIMGPSGSGKSTLMNILGCLDTQTSGKYFLNNIDVKTLSAERKSALRLCTIGFIFQSFNLLPRLSAMQNIELPLVYRGVPKHLRKARVEEMLKLMGLVKRAHHLPSELSGGQRQRVAIGRALINNPCLILADEPTGNLDTKTGMEIMEILRDLNRSGVSIVLITHEKNIADYAARTYYLSDGCISAESC